MGQKNLIKNDLYNPPIKDEDFFHPLTLTLDINERENFKKYLDKNSSVLSSKGELFVSMGDSRTFFPKTLEKSIEFLRPLGLTVRNLTVFQGKANTDGRAIHVDAVFTDQGKSCILEARLSYYEMSEAPGIIRWFPKTEEYFEEKGLHNGVPWVHYTLPWIKELAANKISLAECPDYIFSTSDRTPSAILRTNLPHSVIQGQGTRTTISAQIVWIDTLSPVGVWDHIAKNHTGKGF
jgi:hypothetical protein